MPTKRKPNKTVPGKALLPDRSYIDIALEFANEPPFKTVQDAQEAISRVSGLRFDVVGPDRSDYWDSWLRLIRKEQRIVRDALTGIVDSPDLPSELERKLNQVLVKKIAIKPKLVGGRLQLYYDVEGILGAASLGVVFLLHNDMASLLQQCGQCARFFLAEGNRNRARFCRGECADLNKAEKNRARQRRFHERHKKRRK